VAASDNNCGCSVTRGDCCGRPGAGSADTEASGPPEVYKALSRSARTVAETERGTVHINFGLTILRISRAILVNFTLASS